MGESIWMGAGRWVHQGQGRAGQWSAVRRIRASVCGTHLGEGMLARNDSAREKSRPKRVAGGAVGLPILSCWVWWVVD